MKKLIFVVFISLFVCQTFNFKVNAIEPEGELEFEGIDISNWQGNIDFSNLAEQGIDIVYIKATQGTTYVSTTFESDYNGAKANGLKIGFYHYVTATSTEEAVAEANFFASTISGKDVDCRLAMDFEEFYGLSQNEINAIGLAFMQELYRLTQKPLVVYSDASDTESIWSGEITNYPLWIADYDVESPRSSGSWQTYIGWQYTDTGEINGIEGYVDRDKFSEEIFINGKDGESETLPENQDQGTKYFTITILKGDTLSQIAEEYGTTVGELVSINNIQNPNLIYAQSTLKVPYTTSGGGDDPVERFVYIVKKGDNLSYIASAYGTTVNKIARENGIKNVNLIYPGQRLIIKAEGAGVELGHRYYNVVKGDTLYSIAKRYNTTIAKIVMLNRLSNPNLIYPGERLKI